MKKLWMQVLILALGLGAVVAAKHYVDRFIVQGGGAVGLLGDDSQTPSADGASVRLENAPKSVAR